MEVNLLGNIHLTFHVSMCYLVIEWVLLVNINSTSSLCSQWDGFKLVKKSGLFFFFSPTEVPIVLLLIHRQDMEEVRRVGEEEETQTS